VLAVEPQFLIGYHSSPSVGPLTRGRPELPRSRATKRLDLGSPAWEELRNQAICDHPVWTWPGTEGFLGTMRQGLERVPADASLALILMGDWCGLAPRVSTATNENQDATRYPEEI